MPFAFSIFQICGILYLGSAMGAREMERFLEQSHMDARDLRRRLILSPTPR